MEAVAAEGAGATIVTWLVGRAAFHRARPPMPTTPVRNVAVSAVARATALRREIVAFENMEEGYPANRKRRDKLRSRVGLRSEGHVAQVVAVRVSASE